MSEPMLELPDELDLRSASDKRTFTIDSKTRAHYGVFESSRSRPIAEVTGICLHQTACLLGERPERWLNVGAHYGVTRGGKRLRLHDETDRIVHGNGFNARCVGIEGDGTYAGIEGDLRTVWDDPTTKYREQGMDLPDPFIAAYLETCRAIIRRVHDAGGAIKFILAHRQSSESRQNDPGEGIWKRVALVIMKEFGLHDGGVGFKVDDGRPIPEAWDPSKVGIRY